MITHIVMWNFKKELSEDEKEAAGIRAKEGLEALKTLIPGVLGMKVIVNEAESSTRDLALIGEFESFEALNQYQVHPEHVKVSSFIKSVTCDRVCLDY